MGTEKNRELIFMKKNIIKYATRDFSGGLTRSSTQGGGASLALCYILIFINYKIKFVLQVWKINEVKNLEWYLQNQMMQLPHPQELKMEVVLRALLIDRKSLIEDFSLNFFIFCTLCWTILYCNSFLMCTI